MTLNKIPEMGPIDSRRPEAQVCYSVAKNVLQTVSNTPGFEYSRSILHADTVLVVRYNLRYY